MAPGPPRSGIRRLFGSTRRRQYTPGVTSLEAALRQIYVDLTAAHVSFALVDGLAVSARTEPRFTRDADLAVALASDAEAEALIHSLRMRDYGIEALLEQEAIGRLATEAHTVERAPTRRLSICCSPRRESSPRLWRRPNRLSCYQT